MKNQDHRTLLVRLLMLSVAALSTGVLAHVLAEDLGMEETYLEILPDGATLELMKDERGDYYYFSDQGEKRMRAEERSVAAADEQVGPFIEIMPDGTDLELQKDERGDYYYLNEKGEKIIRADERSAVAQDEKIGPFIEILLDGSTLELQKDERGDYFYINDQGRKVFRADERSVRTP